MENEKKLWYFVGFCSGNVTHIEHEYTNGTDAREMGKKMFDKGHIIQGNPIDFNRVLVMSEDYEIAIDISKIKESMIQ